MITGHPDSLEYEIKLAKDRLLKLENQMNNMDLMNLPRSVQSSIRSKYDDTLRYLEVLYEQKCESKDLRSNKPNNL